MDLGALGQFTAAIGTSVTSVGGRILGDAGAIRGSEYSFNEVNPNVLPPVAVAMRLAHYYQVTPGMSGRADPWKRICLLQGVQFGVSVDNVYTEDLRWAWDDAYNAMGNYPTCNQIVQWWHEGRIPDKEFAPSLVFAGDSSGWWRNHYDTLRQYPDPTTLLALYNRGYYSDQAALTRLKRQTGWEDPDVQKFSNMVNIIPGPSDLIRFAVRDVFNEQLANDLGLFKEYEENKDFPAWCSAQGLRRMSLDLPGYGRVEADWPKMFWGAHWQLPSPTQLYVMLHRLRPNRVQRWAVGGVVPEPVGVKQVNDLLKANDYPPDWRIRLAAIAYHAVGLRDLRRMFMERTIDRDEMREKFLDLGHAPDDAELLTRQMESERDRKENAWREKQRLRELNRVVRALDDAFRLGFISEQFYLQQLLAVNFDEQAATIRINATRLDIQRRLVESQMKAIKQGYFNGFLTVDELISQLILAGIDPPRSVRLAALWESQFTFPRRVATTETILDFVRRGLLSEAEAAIRLRRLGWSNVDTLLHLLKERQVIALDLAKAAEKAARTEAQRQRAIAAQRRAAEAEDRRRRADFKAHSPPEWMVHWLRKGAITKEEAQARWNFIFPDQPNDFEEWYNVNVLGGERNGSS